MAEDRSERLKAALRANLKRRKVQQRGRLRGDEPAGAPQDDAGERDHAQPTPGTGGRRD
jgi:hypothetical protein